MLAEVGLPALRGSGPEADVRAEGAAPRHARVFARDGEIVAEVAEPGLVMRLSGEELREAVLRDGDVIELGVGGPQLRLEAADHTGEQMLEAANMGAYIEFVYNGLIGTGKQFDFEDYAKAIRYVGMNHCILSSDMGQPGNPLHTDGLIAFYAGLRGQGFTQAEIDRMAKENTARLIGLQ